MELHFTISAEEQEQLIEAMKLGHRNKYARQDARLDVVGEQLLTSVEHAQQRWLPACLLVLPLLAVAGVFYFSGKHVTPESGIALAIVTLVYFFCWRRYARVWADAMLARRIKRSTTVWKPSPKAFEATLDWSIRGCMRSVVGQHVVMLGDKALTWQSSDNKAMTLPWRRIVALHETETFYQLIARPALSRATSYFLPKHSRDMDDAQYQLGITTLLQHLANR